MDLAKRRNVTYAAHIITNGYLLDREHIALLEHSCVKTAMVTLDGLREIHDLTRHLAGGQGTFDRIVANLRDNHLPFPVTVRHNVHQGNLEQIEGLRSSVEQLARDSGNDLQYSATPVHSSDVMEQRGRDLNVLKTGEDIGEMELLSEAGRFASHGETTCYSFRNEPEAFALAVYDAYRKKTHNHADQEDPSC